MAKTIKVIDLLNKIANRELKNYTQFRYKNKIFTYRRHDLTNLDTETVVDENYIKLFTSKYNFNLNDTVEILEEKQDIDIQNIEEIKEIYIENDTFGEDIKYLARKYNELVQAVKQLDKNIKDKE